LPKRIIQYARKKAGKNTKALEDLLSDLERNQIELEKSLKEAADREKRADSLIRNYETLQADLAAQRKRFKLEQKERDYQHLSQMNKELEKAVRSAREKENAAEAKKQLERVKKARAKARTSIEKLNTDLESKPVHTKKDWEVGDPVKIAGGTHTGRIERIDRKVATVIVGQLRMDVKLKDLRPANDPLEIRATSSIKSDVTQQSGFNPLLDMRGMRYAEAHDILQKFLDDALLAGVFQVRIVHGKGTGALKKLVEKKISEYPTSEIAQPEDQFGGSGETIVTF
jgi:DNA mismatch repair protein MutS2